MVTNFEIGRRIVEHEQKGAKRAAYGAEVIKELSARLTEEFGRGFSVKNVENMRRFYLLWKGGSPAISQTLSAKCHDSQNPQSPSAECAHPIVIPATFPTKAWPKSPFTLSWSHYVELLGIKDLDEPQFQRGLAVFC